MIIYKIENMVNGKIYIGATTQGLKKRKRTHISASKTKSNGSPIVQALKKYGHLNFKFEQIKKCADDKDLDSSEKYYIRFYKSIYPNGYNVQSGGRNSYGYKHADIDWAVTLDKGEKKKKNIKIVWDREKLGLPIFVDSNGNKLDHADGLNRLMVYYKLTDQSMSSKLKVAEGTVRMWRSGRTINALSMCAIKMFWGE